jgi:predicted DNA-binding ribbon-helix-helix protein
VTKEQAPLQLAIRNVFVGERRTTVRLDSVTWEALHDVAARQRRSIHEIVTEINAERADLSLTTSIRVYIVRFYQSAAIEAERRIAERL